MHGLSVEAQAIQVHKTTWKFQYVHSALFDWIFLLAPFWTSLIYLFFVSVLPRSEVLIFLVAYVLLAETHFGSTWLIYLDPVNRAHFRDRRLTYYGIPALIFVGSLLMGRFAGVKFLFLISAVFSLFHVTRQSMGIVSLYRSKVGQVDPRQRRWEEATLALGSLFFVSIGFIRFYLEPSAPVGWIYQVAGPFREFFYSVSILLGTTALAVGFRAAWMEWQRYRAGKPVSASKQLVFLYSIFLYSPYLFATRIEHAIGIAVSIHYLQYLGLVGLLNRNKYRLEPGQTPPSKLLHFLTQNWLAGLGYITFYGLAMALIRQGGLNTESFSELNWFYSITIALWMIHFYIDGYIWRFSDPFVRKTVAPYLKKMES